MSRFLNPGGERYLWTWMGGQIDFSHPYGGARALLAGVNPYVNDRPEFTNPVFAPTVVDGVTYKQIYPPGSLTTLVPLAALYGDDWRGAARVWFMIDLVCLGALAWIAWALLRQITAELFPVAIALVFLFCLTLDPAAAWSMERGQAEIFTAALCWGGALLTIRRRFAEAMFLVGWAASIKGYAVLVAAGLGIVALDQRAWKAALAGSLAAAGIFVLPCAAWLDDAWHGTWARASLFETYWFNHSFKHLAHRLFGETYADTGKYVAVTIACVATGLALVQAVRAFRRGHDSDRALWITAFCASALGTVVGFSNQSVTYNFVLVTPGLMVLGLTIDRWAAPFARYRLAYHAIGAMVVVTWWLCFVHRLGWVKGTFIGFPATALGLVMFNALALVLAATALRAPTGREDQSPAQTSL